MYANMTCTPPCHTSTPLWGLLPVITFLPAENLLVLHVHVGRLQLHLHHQRRPLFFWRSALTIHPVLTVSRQLLVDLQLLKLA